MYTLLRIYRPRSTGSRLYGHNLNIYKNGAFQRLFKTHLSVRSQTTCPIGCRASTNAAQAKAVIEDEDVQVGFKALKSIPGVATQPGRETPHTSDISFEGLLVWKEPLEVPKTARELFFDYWKNPTTAKPTDLSYWNVLKGEIEGKFPDAQINQPLIYRVDSDHSPDRALTLLFISEYYDQISSSQGLSDEAGSSLMSVINVESPLEAVERVVDLLHYSWVLLADPLDLIQRYITLAKFRQSNNLRPLPKWLLLQILRTRHIDRESLKNLIEWISPRLSCWNWKGTSAMILGVRLVRHVRQVPNPDFEAATAVFVAAMKLRFEEELQVQLRTVTHWCNRFLTLLALPATKNPFRAVKSQQAAQLDILQFMQDFWQEINLEREGYRALTRVQIMHAKTASERQWAEAKALTWPPWEERNRMGAIIAPSHYPGKETRALKVLDRMVESGYAPHRAEASMKILSGWDTDKSPTIQASRVPPPTLRPSEAGPELDETVMDSVIWSSRIEATRTVREAWMIFCTYVNSTAAKTRSQYVYHAMHKKLMAPKANLRSNPTLLPGDGPEVFSDPELARDQVYIPQKVPAISELVFNMLEDKIECNESLLAYFLDHETNLDTGLALLQNSSLSLNIRDILARPHSSSVTDMTEALRRCSGSRLRFAYLTFLTRPNTPRTQKLREYQALPNLRGPEFVRHCLLQIGTQDVRPWNAYLSGLAAHLRADFEGYHRIHTSKILPLLDSTLSYISQRTRPTLETLRIAVRAALVYDFPIEQVKQLFMAVVCNLLTNKSAANWSTFCEKKSRFRIPPSADTIEDMVWVLGSQVTAEAATEILGLLRMVHAQRHQISEAGIRITRHNLAAFRLFLDENWLGRGLGNNHGLESLSLELGQQADSMLCAIGGSELYPDDEYMLKYLDYTTHRRHRVQVKVLKAKSKLHLDVRSLQANLPEARPLAVHTYKL